MIDLAKELSGTFQIQQNSGEMLEILLQPAESWSYFAGHFPHMPILPAVGLLDISQYFINHYLLQNPQASLLKIQALRVKKSVQPGDKLKIVIEKEASGSQFNVVWKSQQDDSTLVADISLTVS